MKNITYQIGQTVMLLDTTFKPAVSAVIKDLNEQTNQYFVEYQLPNNAPVERIWVPQERLSSQVNIIPSAK